MCFPQFYSILLTKIQCSIISAHSPFSNNIFAFHLHFLTSLKTLLGSMPISLIFLTACSFIALATAFVSALFNLLYSFCVSSVGFFFVSLYAFLFYLILCPTVPPTRVSTTSSVFLRSTYFIASLWRTSKRSL